MKPTQQEIIELARESRLMSHIPFPSDSLVAVALSRFATLLLEHFGAGGGKPVATVQRLAGRTPSIAYSQKRIEPLAHGTKLYSHPSPTDLRAEYLRGLEDAAKLCDVVSLQANAAWKLAYKPQDQGREMGADECADEIRALKGKQ